MSSVTTAHADESQYAELHAFLTDDNGTCEHTRYIQLVRDLPFVTEGISSEEDARELLQSAHEDGAISVHDDADFGRPDTTVHKPACATLTPNESTTDTPASESDPGASPAEPADREKDDYTRELEDRVDDLENTVETLVETVETYEAQLEQVTHGLTELQANKLARGGLISTKGADVDRLNSIDVDGLDFSVNVAGNRDVVRADNTKVGDSGTAVNELPDFESLIPLEADRQRLRYGIDSREDIGGAMRRRAVDVWQDIHVLNSNSRDKVIIEHSDLREKVSSILNREGNPQEGETLSETTRRVRRKLADLSDGILNVDKGTQPHRIIGRREDVQDARLEDGSVARGEDGDAMVLNGGK